MVKYQLRKSLLFKLHMQMHIVYLSIKVYCAAIIKGFGRSLSDILFVN